MVDSELTTARPEWYVEEDFDDAQSFFTAIQPTDDRWKSKSIAAAEWMFRGQASADWQLLPRLFRDPTEKFIELAVRSLESRVQSAVKRLGRSGAQDIQRATTVLRISAAEREMIERFREIADSVGHDVGDKWQVDGQGWLAQLSGGSLGEEHCWPDSVAAAAQHHGVPTRALDWTLHPFHALFFAVAGSGDFGGRQAERLAVWAISRLAVAERGFLNSHAASIRRVHVPASRVSYLRAQQGVLLFDPRANSHYLKHGRWPDFKDAIAKTVSATDSILLRKLTVPTRAVAELRQKLLAHRISHAFLMPTLDNVTRTLFDVLDSTAPSARFQEDAGT